MHFMAFALKRAHLSSLNLVRPWLARARSPITPARHDLLYALHQTPSHRAHQTHLRRALGLAASTVSRALRRLEQLGIIRRDAHARDRRRKVISFTEYGLREFLHALDHIFGDHHLDLAYEGALGPPTAETFLFLDDVYFANRHIAQQLGDTSALVYPTGHPDD